MDSLSKLITTTKYLLLKNVSYLNKSAKSLYYVS